MDVRAPRPESDSGAPVSSPKSSPKRGPRPSRGSPPAPEVGNRRALSHGAYAPGLVDPAAQALADELYARYNHLSERDLFAVLDYAVAQVRVWRLASYLHTNSDFDRRGGLRPAVEALRRWLERAERARARLGLDPAARLSLGVDESLIYERLQAAFAPDVARGKTAPPGTSEAK